MVGALHVIDDMAGTSAMPKSTISELVANEINKALGLLPIGEPKDYGFITGPVDNLIDYGVIQ